MIYIFVKNLNWINLGEVLYKKLLFKKVFYLSLVILILCLDCGFYGLVKYEICNVKYFKIFYMIWEIEIDKI